MKQEQILEVLKIHRLLPLVTIENQEDILPIGHALIDGGLPIVEIAYRSSFASATIQELTKIPELIVGAGTITSRIQAEEAVANGAQFIVTPGWSQEVVSYAQEHDILICPGVVSPSEVMEARKWNLHHLKFFPAGSYGGMSTIKALHGPFPDCCFIPTGGIDVHNYKDYLALKYVTAVGGSFITPKKYIEEKDWRGLSEYIHSLIL